jgi:endoglucanase
MKMMEKDADVVTVIQLYITTKEKKYADRFLEKIWLLLERSTEGTGTNSRLFAGFGGKRHH